MSDLPFARAIGVVGQGVGSPSPRRTTPELCVLMFHPPVTYSPWMDMTWCLCGRKTWQGNVAMHGVACCRGPLTERNEL